MRNYYINNMEKLTLKIAERQESGLILEYIKKLADYEKDQMKLLQHPKTLKNGSLMKIRRK